MRKAIEFRFSLSHATEGEVEIDEPIGWDKSTFSLKRDDKYKAITFEYSSSLRFYRSNGVHNGGGDFILYILDKYGPDEVLNLLVEVSDHNGPFETVFEGILNLEDITETVQGVECQAIQNDFFTIFNQRNDLNVSFKDNLSVDGVALQSYEPYTLNMHSKVLVKQTKAEIAQQLSIPPSPTHEFTINFGPPGFPDPQKTGIGSQPALEFVTRTSYLQFDFSGPTADELKNYWKVAGAALPEEPPVVYTVAEAGIHKFDIFLDLEVLLSVMHLTSSATSFVHCGANDGLLDDIFIDFVFLVRDVDGNEKYVENVSWGHTDACGQIYKAIDGPPIYFTPELTLAVDDEVFVYAKVRMDAKFERLLLNSKVQYLVGYLLNEGSRFKITGKTFTAPSTAPAMRVHDVFANLCNKLTNRNDSFYSEDFGYIGAPYHSYSDNGALSDFAIQNGFNIRNFPWEDRPLQLDFTTLFDSLDAIFGLSLNMEVIGGLPTIRVERLSYAYSKDPILVFNHVNKIKRTLAKEKYYNQIQIGYEQSLPQEINGLDEICTKHTYTTELKTMGNTLVLLSKVIASGSLIEVTRRNQYNETLTTDTEYDNSLFIISLAHGVPTKPETNEYFDTVNNLLSPETAYNLRLWPAFNLLRQGNRINGGLLKKWGSYYKFQSGEGNYIVELEMSPSETVYPGSYNAELLKGGTNIPWSYADLPEVTPLWTCDVFEFKYPFSLRKLNTLKANRNKSILITGDILQEAVSVVVLEVSSEVVNGLGSFKALGNSIIPFPYVPETADHLLLENGFDLLLQNGDLILL